MSIAAKLYNDETSHHSRKIEYENFCTDLNTSLEEYIKANRDLMKENTTQVNEIIRQRIKNLLSLESSYCLNYYLSNKESRFLIDKMIVSDLPVLQCCNKIILNGLRRGFRNLRGTYNLTVKKFSDRLCSSSAEVKISPSVISKIENGYIKKFPKYELIERIKRVFNCDEEYIFGIIDFPKRHGDMHYSPITHVTFNTYASVILGKEEYNDIHQKLAAIYSKRNNQKDIKKIRDLLNSLVSDDELF